MKKVFYVIFLFVIFIGNVKSLDIVSNNAILYNLNDDKVIYEKNSNDKVQIASLTKIVTAITVINNVDDLSKTVKINYNMINDLEGYAKINLKVNDELSYEELLYALMLPSAADAAKALAISISGSTVEFASLMNEEVKDLNLSNTLFDNPIGMDSDNNYSTASDLAIILKYALKNDIFYKLFTTNEYYIKSINKTVKKTTIQTSKNNNLDYKNILGSKTGYTDLAGLCLASISNINEVKYLAIVLGSPINFPYNIKDTIDMYEYYSNNYSYKTVLTESQLVKTIKVKDSKLKEYNIYSKEDVNLYLENSIDINDLTYAYEGLEYINKNNKINDKLGTYKVLYNDEVLYETDIYLTDNIKFYNYKLWNICVVSALLILIFFIVKKLKKK